MTFVTLVIDMQVDYPVILAEGCFDSHDAEHHAVSQRYLHGKLAAVLTVDTIITLLERSTE